MTFKLTSRPGSGSSSPTSANSTTSYSIMSSAGKRRGDLMARSDRLNTAIVATLAAICVLLFGVRDVILKLPTWTESIQELRSASTGPASGIHAADYATTTHSVLTGGDNLRTHEKLVEELYRWKDPQYARQRLRIYYYDLPLDYNEQLVANSHANPPKIRDPFCDTNFYSAEHAIAQVFKNHAVRTHDPTEADFFYVPIYTTCYLLTNLPNNTTKTGEFFSRGLDMVINEYPYWNQSDGRDHLFMFAQGFGARLAGDWNRISNAIFLVHNGDYAEAHFSPHKDIVVPPHLTDYLEPVALSHRKTPIMKKSFAMFGGQVVKQDVSDHRGSNYSGGVRQYIEAHLRDREGYKITGVRSKSYVQDMRESVFCLAPTGWHKWSPRPAYAMLLRCIPVVISEEQILPFENLIDYRRTSVWIKPSEVDGMDDKLRRLSQDTIAERLEAIDVVWPLFWYGDSGLAGEAILYSLSKRVTSSKAQRLFA